MVDIGALAARAVTEALKNAGYRCHLTGSRRVGYATEQSDWDYWVEGEVEAVLEVLKAFRPTHNVIYAEAVTGIALSITDYVHIIVVDPRVAAIREQVEEWLRDNAFAVYLLPKRERRIWYRAAWEQAKRELERRRRLNA